MDQRKANIPSFVHYDLPKINTLPPDRCTVVSFIEIGTFLFGHFAHQKKSLNAKKIGTELDVDLGLLPSNAPELDVDLGLLPSNAPEPHAGIEHGTQTNERSAEGQRHATTTATVTTAVLKDDLSRK
jgi:hypothetical protein